MRCVSSQVRLIAVVSPSYLPLASILYPRALAAGVPRLLADVARLLGAALVLLLLAPERELLLLLLLAVGHRRVCGYSDVGTARSASLGFFCSANPIF